MSLWDSWEKVWSQYLQSYSFLRYASFHVFFFIFSDDKPIGCIFYNEELFEELGKRKEIGFDGTFYVVPSPFYQLWTGKISKNEPF